MAFFARTRKLSKQEAGTYLSAEDHAVGAPEVLERIRSVIREHLDGRSPLYLFFDVETVGVLPDVVAWKDWKVEDLSNEQVAEYPHIMQLAWVFSDEFQNIVAARNLLIRPEGWTIPDVAYESHGISMEKAMSTGVPLKAAMSEFATCLAPKTHVCTFDASFDAAVVEVEFRRVNMRVRFNPVQMCNLRERARTLCELPPDIDGEEFRPPRLQDVYEKLFCPFEISWNDAAADVQITQHCFFEMLKRRLV